VAKGEGARIELASGGRESEASVSVGAIQVRTCQGLEELRACVALQKEVWNFADSELVPLRMFVVAEKVGGQVMGAFDGEEMVGFALSIPGTRSGHIYLHSHMLAVRQEHRNSGLGRGLKLLQREEALSRGIELIEWTFDPLEIKNAYLNIEKLGAIARRYTINQYGITSSPLQGGLPSDRLIAEWWLKSKRVETLLATGKNPAFSERMSIEVPSQIYEWKAAAETRGRARQTQERNREQFLRAFGEDLAVLGYERDAAGNGKFRLGAWDEKWSYASEG
jgi:predicted GNAT superfamily acetyltransferase